MASPIATALPRQQLLVEELETRILYSADAAALLGFTGAAAEIRQVDAPNDGRLAGIERAGQHALAQSRELVFVDSRVPDAISLADELIRARGGSHLFDIVVLQAGKDGLAQIGEVLAGERGLAAIHIISHGSDGAIEIGDSRLDADRLAIDGASVARWGDALAAGGDLLLYGCQVAEDVAGRAFVQQLALLTGADVAASRDATGSEALGANWTLEHATGRIEASDAAASLRLVQWQGVLATVPGTAIYRDAAAGATPQTSRWDGSSFAAMSNSASAGAWKIVEAAEAPARDEVIAIGIDDTGAIQAQVWDGSSWSLAPPVSGLVSESTYHAFDVAYDEATGNAMVVWSDAGQLVYSVWDGTSWSARADITAYAGDEPLEVRLAARPGGGEMIVIVGDKNNASQALVWDGSTWAQQQALGAATSTVAVVGVEYEQTSGHAMVVYASGSSGDAYYRRWVGGAWSTEQTLSAPAAIGSAAHWTQVATDASAGSNRIAVGFVTSAPRSWFAVWDGSAWNADDKHVVSADAPSASELTVDVAFEHDSGVLIAAYAQTGDSNVFVNRWASGIGWDAQEVAAVLVTAPNSISLDAAPYGDAVMLMVQSQSQELHSSLWNGTIWAAPVQLTGNTTQTRDQPFAFAWDMLPTPTELTVDTTSDVADGNTASIGTLLSNKGADGRISLREAILATNNTANGGSPDTIRFDIADALIAGAHTIRPTSALPTLSDAVVIDATTEPDYDTTPVIEIDGSLAGGTPGALGISGLRISAGGSTIKGIAINQFSGAGVRLDTSGGNVLQANHIGTDVTGTIDRGNAWHGIHVQDTGSNTIGGNLAAQGNLISGNESHGVLLGASGATANQLLNNRIGTAADGTTALGNSGSGVVFDGSPVAPVSGNLVGSNTIAWNGGQGVTVKVGTGNSILGNRIHSNSGLGIDLGDDGVTANDAGDADSGSNGLQNFPLITNASTDGSVVRIFGTLSSTASRNHRIEFFASPGSDPSGHGEGRTHLGSVVVVTDALGNASFDQSFTAAVAAGHAISATATDATSDDTSEFAASFTAIASAPPVVALPGLPASYAENAAPVVVDASASVSDIDSADFNGGTLTIDLSASATANDRLGIRDQGTGAGQIGVSGSNVSHGGIVIGSFAGGTDGSTPLVISLNANASGAATQQLLRNITFSNVSDNPSTAARTVRVVLTDGDGGTSTPVTQTVNLTAVNDAPTVGSGALLAYTENQAAAAIDPALTIGDVDSTALAGATVAITSGFASGQDSLVFSNQNGISGSWNAAAGVLTLSGTAPLADYQAALRSVAYANASDNPSTVSRTVSFTVSDGSATSAAANATVGITAVNDAPTATNLNAAQTYTEDAPLTLTPIVISDVDSATATATLTLSNPAAGSLATGTSGSVTSTWNSVTGVWSASGAVVDVNALLAALVFTPATNANADFSITTSVTDGVAAALTGSKTLTGTAVNDAPTIASSNNLGSINRNPVANPGTLVADLIVGHFNDIDTASPRGIAVTAVNNGSGNWEFSTDGGGSWTSFGSPQPSSARLLIADAASYVRFVPNANWSGSVTNGLSYRAWDRSTGLGGGTVDTATANGGTTAFSTSVVSASIVVTASNTAPTISGAANLAAINEDPASNGGTPVSALISGRTGDVDPGAATGIAVTAVDNSNGQWQYTRDSGSTWVDFGSPSAASARLLAADAATSVRFVPNADWNGVVGNGITFRAWDQTSGTAGTTANTAGTAGHLLDTFSAVSYSNNNGSLAWTGDWVENDSGGDGASGGWFQVSGGQLQIVAHENGDFFWRQADLSGATSATLSMSYVSGIDGSAELRIEASADGGATYTALPGATFKAGTRFGGGSLNLDLTPYISSTTRIRFFVVSSHNSPSQNQLTFDNIRINLVGNNGGATAFSTATASSSAIVSAVNDAPVRSAGTVADLVVLEDAGATSLGLGALTHARGGGADEAGQTLTYSITAVPSAALGSITLADGTTTVSSGTSYTLAQLRGMMFKPAADANGGPVTFGWRVTDNGGTANGGIDALNESLSVSVTPVNDAPSGIGKTITVAEDTPIVFTPSDFGFSDANDTPAHALQAVRITALPTAGSLTHSGLVVAAGQTVSASDITAGLLRYTPATHANGSGYSSFSFQVQDSGGIANGGIELDPTPNTIIIDVTPVNDAPTVITSNSTLAYPIGTASTAVDAALTVGDVDHVQLSGATVSISGGYVNGRDQLGFTSQPGISFVWNATTGVLTLSGNATVDAYQTALRGVTFQTSSTVSGTRLIAFTASDGSATSSAASRSVTVGQEVPALWISSVGNSTTSAGSGALNFNDGQVARLSNPNLTLGSVVSNGSFTSAFDIDRFSDNNADVEGLHVVHTSVVVGTVNPITLQRGDILVSIRDDNTLGGVAVRDRDIVRFRPNTPGDYRSGSFSVLIRDPLDGVDVRDFALVETAMTIGGTAVQAGDFLIVGQDNGHDRNISRFRPTTMSSNPTGGTRTLFIDGNSPGIDFDQQITGLELVQYDTTLGGKALTQGQLLVSLSNSATVGTNNLSVASHDIFVLNVTATGNSTSSGTAAMLMRGNDLGLSGGEELLDAVALVGVYNTAPTLDSTASPLLASVAEESGAPVGAVGTLVSSLVDFAQPAGPHDNVADPDTDSQLGIAVIVADVTSGSWWYSTDGGSNWVALGSVSNASAKLLAADADTRLYFRPNANYAGTLSSAITFRAWDSSVGTNGSNHSTTINGGATAFSSSFDTAQLTVTAINDAPLRTSAAPSAIVANEDSAASAAVSLGLGSLTYAPGGGADESVQGLAAEITAIPASVTLWLADGTTAVPLGSTLTIAQLQALRYRTVADAHGSALLTWTIRDSGGTANGGANSIADDVSITITPANDAPVLGGSNALDGINQNTTVNPGTRVSDLIASRVADADAGALGGIAVTAVDNTNGSWQYSRDGGTTWTAFGGPSAGAARLLAADASTFVRFAPNANWVGEVSPGLTFRAWDQTSGSAGLTADTTANGATSAFSSAIASASVQVSAWPVLFTGSYSENFTSLGTSGTQMAVGYRAMLLSGSGSSYDAGAPITAAGIAGATVGNQNLLVWKPGDFNIIASNRLANAGSIGDLADRTLATGPSNNAASVIELAMRNATAGPLASVQFAYDLKVLADGENGDTEAAGRPGYAFFYSLTGGTSAAEWISVPALATTATTVGSVTSVSTRIDFATPLAAGSMMYFRWADDNADNLSPDQNFGVDNVSVQRINAPPVLSAVEVGPLVWQEEAAAAPISSTLAVGDIDDANLSGATVAITSNHASGQDLLVFTDQNGISGSWDAATGVLTLTGSSSLANYQAALRSVAYLNTSDAPSTASRTVTFSVRDAGATSNLVTRTVDVVARNDAPLLTGSNNLPAINRNPSSNPGMLVADLLTGQAADPDAAGALHGIAVTAVDNSNGNWQYSTDGGSSWTSLGTPSDASARLLAADASTRVRFVPATDWAGIVTDGLRFRAWDQATGSAGTVADVRTNGGDTAFSSSTAAASISVGTANTAPVLSGANGMTRIAEDAVGNAGTSVAALIAGRVSDADPGALAGIAVIAVDNSNGSWQYSSDGGGSWLAFGAPSGAAARLLAADASTFVRFVPAADFNGSVGAGITFRAWDRSAGLAGTTADLTSTSVVRDNFSTVSYDNNDGSARWSTPWLDVDSGPVGGSYRVQGGQLEIRTNNTTDSLARQVDLSGATSATLSFDHVSDLNDGSGGRIDIQVSNNGGASYTSLASFTATLRTGTGSFSADISAWIAPQTRIRFVTLGLSTSERLHVDNLQIAWSSMGGGANAFSTASAAAPIAIDAVNDAPVRSSAAPAAITTSEDGSNLSITSLGLAGLAYGPGGASDEASQTLSYTVTAVPPMITAWLADGSTPVSAGSTLTLAQLRGLSYRTVANANGSGNLSWTVRDSGGTALSGVDTLSQSLAITVTPVNDAPVTATGGSTLGYVENQAASPVAPALTLGDIDSATLASAQVTIFANFAAGEDRLVFTNQNGIAGSFNAATGVLSLSGVSSIANYQAALRSVGYFNTSENPSGLTRTVSFMVNDGALASSVDTSDVTVSPVNDAPVIAAGGTSLAYTENQAARVIDPALTLADVDNTTLAAATVRISVNFAAGEDRLVFTNQNGIAGSFDAAAGVLSLSGASSLANYQAALRSVAYLNTSDDPSGLTRTVSFSVADGALTSTVATTVVSVTPINDAPVVNAGGGSLAYVENQAASPVDPALTLADVDHASLASATVRISGNFAPGEDRLDFVDQNGISGSYDPASGVLSLGGVSSVANYQAALRSVAYRNLSDNPSALTRTVSFMVSDGALASNLASRTVAVTAVNDAPVASTSGGSLAYTENQAATAIDPALTLSDHDDVMLASATVRITGNFAGGEDRLVFVDQSGISGSFDAATGVLVLTGPATVSNYQAALRSVAYLNTSDDPSALTRTVSFMVSDGALGSNTANRDVLVTPVNDAPVTTTSGGNLAYTENQVATVIDAGLTLADLDNTTLASATVRISSNFAAGEDRLVFIDQNGISSSFDAATGILVLTGPATVSNYQAALRSVAYLNTSDDPSGLTRTISFMVSDGGLGSNIAVRDVRVTPINDAPVTATSGGTQAHVENQLASAIDPALTLADSDHATLASATIRLSGNFAPGEDRLVFADQNGISGSFDTATGVLSLAGASSVANYQAALRSVAYLNTSDDPSGLTRTVSFSVDDGALASNVADRDVIVTPVNDAPMVWASSGNAAYTENQSAVTVDAGLRLNELDDSTLASAVVDITGNFASGEDRLVFVDQNGIAGSFDAATGVLSLSGVSSVANYEAALRSVTYLNTSDDPSGLARTVSFRVNDGALTSNAASRQVSVTPVNDAPVVATDAGLASYTENQSAVPVDPALTLGDLDNPLLASARVAITGNFAAGEDRLVFVDQNGIIGSFDAATGVLNLNGISPVASYQAALRSVAYLNTSDDPSGLTRNVSFSVDDGALSSNVAHHSVVVTPVNDAPVVTIGAGSASYTENQAPSAIDPALTLADVDNLSITSATVAITGPFAGGEDRLVFGNQNGISGSFDAATGVLSLTGSASVADYQAALRSVAYLNTSDDPSGLTRTVSYTVSDGSLQSIVGSRSLAVTPVNDAPVVATSAGNAAYTENQSPVAIDPALTLADLDDTSLVSATVAIIGNFLAGEDHLDFVDQNGISGSFDGATGVLSLVGVSSAANYESALRSIVYLNTSNDPSGLARTVAFQVNDGALQSHAATRAVVVTPVNDAPVATTTAGAASYIENQSGVAIDPALTLADIDNATLASATLAIIGNVVEAEDRLVFADQNGITGSFDATTGVLSLTGVSSVADYQAALRSVSYLNTSDDPSALVRTVSFSVNDGTLASTIASRGVVVTPVNDAPVATASAGAASYTENQLPVAIDPALTLADLDNLSLASATVAITGHFAIGEDRLVFGHQNGISGSFDAATGVLSLTGSASIADYQAALRSVTYLNTSDDPSALTRTVAFTVNDGALDSTVARRDIAFTAVNDAPVTGTSSGSLAYTENQAATAVDPALTLSDVDSRTLASATVSISGNFAAGEDRLVFADQNGISGRFYAATGVLHLSGVASVADYQAALRTVAYLNTSDDPSALVRTVSFSVNDGALDSHVASRSVGFTAVNDAPVAGSGAGTLTYIENQAATSINPVLTLVDVDNTTLASATVAISGNFAAGEDRLVFADQSGISGSFDAATGVLRLSGVASVADYQAALRSVTYLNTSDDPSALARTVSFSVNDGALDSNVASRSVDFTAVNDAPVANASAGTLTYVENQVATPIDAGLNLSDLDNTTLASATVAISGNFAAGEDRLVFADQNGISGSFEAATGVLTLRGIASVADYQAALRTVAYLNTSDDPSALVRTVSFSVSDGALDSHVASRNVGFTAVNDVPVAGSGAGSLAYVENQAATVIGPALTLVDVDNTTLASATITISGNFAGGEDRLVFADQNGISGSFDAATGVLRLSGVASVADYQAALRTVAYLNTSDDPSALVRTVSFTVNDGSLDSNMASRSVELTPVNDAPVASASAGTLTYVENQVATPIDAGLSLSDLDNTTLASATVAISGNFAADEDRLVFADQNGISGSFDAATGVLTLSGIASVADYQGALRTVAYLNTSDDPSALVRTVSFSVNDGALDSHVASRSVGFTAVNDAPVAGSGAGTLAYIENQAGTPINPALTLVDVDNTTLASATVAISGNFAAGEDRLVFADQSGISGSFDAATGVLRLSGVASVGDYQGALRSVAYLNTSDDPSALARTVSFSVNDGALDSNVASRNVDFTAVNDAPVASASAGTLTHVENQVATPIDAGLNLSDLDNTTLASATVTISGNFAAGEDRLVFADQSGISGSFDAATGVLRLSGVASVADYQGALRSVAYLNTSDDPSALVRTVSFSVNDGALDSHVASRSVGFTAVNDAPVAGSGAGTLAYIENQAATVINPALTLVDVDNTTLASATVAISGNFAGGEDRLVFADQNGISGRFDAATGVLTLSGVASVADYQAALRSVAYLNTSDDPSALVRTVSFSVNDGALDSATALRAVNFTAVNDSPVARSGAGSLAYIENQAATSIDPALTLVDVDNTTLASATVTISGNFAAGEDRLVFADQNGISGRFDAATGVLTLSGIASVADYQAALRTVAYLNTSDDPSALARTVSFSVNDGALDSHVASRSVGFTAVNDAPVASASGGTLAYIENQAATSIDPALTLVDVDNTTLASATVSIGGNFAGGEDRLVFADQNGISGRFDAATGVLTLSGIASVADYQAALRSVAYLNTSDDPNAHVRTVSFRVDDGALASSPATRNVGFTAVNDAPVATTGAGSLAHVENQLATSIDPALTLADLDNTTLASATVAITGNLAAGEDRLVFNDQNNITGSFDAGTGVLTLNGLASIGDYQTALRSVAYLNTSDDASALTRTISFSVHDGGLASRSATRDVTVTPINDAPVIASEEGGLAHTENQAATPIDPTLSLVDLDDVTLSSAAVSISSNFAAGEDRLVFTDQDGIVGSFDGASGVLRLSGTASVAAYQAALRSVAYLNTSDDPSALTRTVSFSVSDAALRSAPTSLSVSVVAVGDPPTSKPIVLASIKEDSGPRTITQSELLAAAGDLDSTTLRAERLVIATGRGELVDNADGSWTYTPAADDDTEATFSYIVSDPVLTTAGRALLDLAPVDDAPLLALSTLPVQGGSRLVVDSKLLQANDTDNPASALSFVVVDSVHGRFEAVDAPGTPVERFTQADVDAGRIALVSTHTSQAPDFRIAAYDGNSYSGMIVAKIDFRRTAFASTSGDAGIFAGLPPPLFAELPVLGSGTASSSNEGTKSKSAQSADSSAGNRQRIGADPVTASAEPVETTESGTRGVERGLPTRASTAERPQRPRIAAVGEGQLDLAARISVDDYVTEVAEFELLDLSQQQRTSSARGPAVDARSEATGDGEETSGELDLGQAAAASGLVLSAGTIWWALRAGSLLTGLMVSLPAWRHADLLAVLPDEEDEDVWESAEDHESARDERAVDRVFESGATGEQR